VKLCFNKPMENVQINAGCDRMVCACYHVRESELKMAIEREGLSNINDVIRRTGAGDACTSCHPKIELMLEEGATRPQACCRQSAQTGNSPTQSL